ncbi:MAG: class I SAM-dependent DNA methyltransferase [Nitrospirota bacterium]
MKIFNNYARYYDLLYKDKHYAEEALHVHQLISKYAPGARSVLELGCGTGMHARALAEMGYTLHGVDQSTEMLEAASRRRMSMDKASSSRLSFSAGDIRSVRLSGTFDAVISLFHVVSYQTTDADLAAAVSTAKHHLNAGGVFLFDCWHGPAVQAQRPEVRVKRFEDDQVQITRIAEPVLHDESHIAEVNYQMFIRDKHDDSIEELRETHRMRYLFDPEVAAILREQGMTCIDTFEWLTGKTPGSDTWGVCYVVKA